MATEAPLNVGTPGSVTGSWNSERKVALIQADAKWCRAAVTPGSSGTANFKVCSVNREGIDCCVKSTHHDVLERKKGVVRLDVTDDVGVLLIVVPASGPAVKQTSCFSRPMLRLSSYPPELLCLGRWEALLELRLRPVVWRILLEEYEGSLVIYQVGAGKPASKPPPEPIKAEALGGNHVRISLVLRGGKKSLWAISLPLS